MIKGEAANTTDRVNFNDYNGPSEMDQLPKMTLGNCLFL